ncbi:hypothetical protein [Nocardia sp. R6R-6]|uniref:hypothetical protein n=1 Tax=Nocardia sp. R6R-6 TaxID=3459303 RepID=UPI00403E1CC0
MSDAEAFGDPSDGDRFTAQVIGLPTCAVGLLATIAAAAAKSARAAYDEQHPENEIR